MKIEFTKEQYEDLIKMAYLGNWIVNANRDPEETIPEYEELEQYILSHAKDFGLEDIVEEEDGMYCISEDYNDDQMGTYLEEYNDEIFWDELASRLAIKQAINVVGEEELNNMDEEESIPLIENLKAQYDDELFTSGLSKVELTDFEPSLEETL